MNTKEINMTPSKGNPQNKPPSTKIQEIEEEVSNVNRTIQESIASNEGNNESSTNIDALHAQPDDKENKEVIDIENQGKNQSDAIDMCCSVASSQKSIVVLTDNVTDQLNLQYGKSWLQNKDYNLSNLPDCEDSTIQLMTTIFNNTTHINRRTSIFYDLKYPFLHILCNTLQWLNCEIINSTMQLLNNKAQINQTDDEHYFHKTYRYNYVTKPVYGKMNSCHKEKRGFSYPNGKNFC